MAWLVRWLHVAGLQLTARGQSPWMQRQLKLRNGRARVAIAYELGGRAGLSASSGSSKGLDEAIKTEIDKVDKAWRKARALPGPSSRKRLGLLRAAKRHEAILPDPERRTAEQLGAHLYQENEKLS